MWSEQFRLFVRTVSVFTLLRAFGAGDCFAGGRSGVEGSVAASSM